MDEFDITYMSEYDIEIERKKHELEEMYRKEGASRYVAFQEGGFLAFILLIPLSIWAICVERTRVFGIVGLVGCILSIILIVVGLNCRSNKIDRLEREIIELKEKKKQEEQKYAQYQNDSFNSARQ